MLAKIGEPREQQNEQLVKSQPTMNKQLDDSKSIVDNKKLDDSKSIIDNKKLDDSKSIVDNKKLDEELALVKTSKTQPDINKLSNEQINFLLAYNFNQLQTTIKVINVIEGHIFDAIFYYPFTSDNSIWIPVKKRFQLYGIKANNDYVQYGKLAFDLMLSVLSTLKNPYTVYAKASGYTQEENLLVTLYIDETYDMNQYLSYQKAQDGTMLFIPYLEEISNKDNLCI